MRAKLTLLYSTSAFATLVVLTVAMFLGLQKNINRDEENALVREMGAIDDLLRDPSGNAALINRAVDPGQGGDAAGEATYIRVRDDSHVLFETSGMAASLPISAFATALGKHRANRYVTNEGHAYLLAAARVARPEDSPDHSYTIESATDLTNDDKLVDRYRDDMFIVLLCGCVLCALGGYLVTHQGLKPLEEITLAIKRTRAEQLHHRLDPAQWPSELRQLAFEFDQMRLRLEDSFNRLKHLSADLAHDLRTPVHAMMGQTEVALSKHRSNEEYQALLESNLEEQGRLARLIDNLLFLARADNAQTALVRDTVDVGKELDTVMAYFDAIAQEQQITLCRDGTGLVHADRSLFSRAVSNLVSNALRHSKPGGSVRLVADRGPDGSTRIRVIDEGTGIGAGQLNRVFERFYRGDDVGDKRDGAGLGLAIVRSIMTLHGGSVDIASAPHCGTTATLTFPA